MTKAKIPLVNDVELAKYINKKSKGEYFLYEIKDVIDLLVKSIEELVVEGKQVRLKEFGVFKLKKNSTRVVSTKPMNGEVIHSEESHTLKFTAYPSLQAKIKQKVKEKKE